MSAAFGFINAFRANDTGVVELARPNVFNCLSIEMFDEIGRALREYEQDPSMRALLIQAQGKHFCTGADLAQFKAKRASRAELDEFLQSGHVILRALEGSRLPVIAAVRGLCLAGGLELVLACDVVFADRSARFGDQHAQFGLAPGWGGSQRLPRAIGLRRAMDLFFSARWIDAETASSWGLVNYVSAEGAASRDALDYCAKLSERSADGLALMKRLARRGLDLGLGDALPMAMAEVAEPLRSAQVGEGIAAFEQKRKPNFC
jgi:enoyl-CoA hydratase/carnithine racemase